MLPTSTATYITPVSRLLDTSKCLLEAETVAQQLGIQQYGEHSDHAAMLAVNTASASKITPTLQTVPDTTPVWSCLQNKQNILFCLQETKSF